LIGFTLEFVQHASQLAGIRDIALIGSLCTDKEYPKDADLLVSVADDMSLSPLAAHARRLQGRAQSIGHGADVFLASEGGEYLGRICPWKICRPGIRLSCDALDCGRREYLHNDLRTLRLSRELIAAPPLRLWPNVVIAGTVPSDIAELLIRKIVP
jgi:hypothetical protein